MVFGEDNMHELEDEVDIPAGWTLIRVYGVGKKSEQNVKEVADLINLQSKDIPIDPLKEKYIWGDRN